MTNQSPLLLLAWVSLFQTRALAQQTPRPALLANNNATFCSGVPITFTIVTPIPAGCAIDAGMPYELYRDGNLVDSASSNQIFRNSNKALEGNYSVKVRFAANPTCSFPQTNESNPITIHKTPLEPNVSFASAIVPVGNSIALTATTNTVGAAGLFTWSLGGNLLYQGAIFNTLPATVGMQTYSLRENRNGCQSPAKSIDIAGEVLTAPSVLPALKTTCIGGNITLTAQNGRANAVVKWYDAATSTNPIAIGSRFTTPHLNTNTSFWVSIALGQSESPKEMITVQVEALPKPVTTLAVPMVCNGLNTNLLATSNKGVIHWYSAASNGNLLLVGNSYTTPHLTQTTSYWAEAVENTCKSERLQMTVTVHQNPATPLVENNTPCEGDTLRVKVTNHSNNMQFFWTGTNHFSNNNPSFQITPANEALHQGNYTVYVKDSVSGCISGTKTINADILPAPRVHLVESFNVKDGETATLNVTGGDTYTWTPTLFLDKPNSATPKITPVLHTGIDTPLIYNVLVTQRSNQCTARASTKINVTTQPNLVIHDLITPNGDGKNDEWFIDYLYNITNYEIKIVDKNGNLVFETTDYPNHPFKGEKSTNDKLPDGTYWYMIHVTSPFAKTYTGALTLLHGRFN